ncbi:MAG: catalase [Lachnospiraceae bacterium]|nr:catalase [Lachnospiraceae bacterium]
MKTFYQRLTGHFCTISRHKWLVTKTCFRVGMYRQGIAHDLSKYAPVEFFAGVKYWQGTRSPINKEKEVLGYSLGWLHHKGRNRHHFEYWIDYAPDPSKGLQGMKIPKKYVAEMAIDRICASMNYQKENYTSKSAWDYYYNGRNYCVMHPEAQFLLEFLLKKTAEEGEEAVYNYIRYVLLKHKNRDYHVTDGKLILD